jgi:hypothetical protein
VYVGCDRHGKRKDPPAGRSRAKREDRPSDKEVRNTEQQVKALERDISALEERLNQLSSELARATDTGDVDEIARIGQDYEVTQDQLDGAEPGVGGPGLQRTGRLPERPGHPVDRLPAHPPGPRIQLRPKQFEHALVLHPFGDSAQQHVVLDPIKELFQIDVHHPAVP